MGIFCFGLFGQKIPKVPIVSGHHCKYGKIAFFKQQMVAASSSGASRSKAKAGSMNIASVAAAAGSAAGAKPSDQM